MHEVTPNHFVYCSEKEYKRLKENSSKLKKLSLNSDRFSYHNVLISLNRQSLQYIINNRFT